MKKLKSILFFWVTISTQILAYTVADFPEETFVLARSGLNLRDRPNLKSKHLTLLAFCQKVKIIDTTSFVEKIDGIEAPWFKIRTNENAIGWVFGGYLARDYQRSEPYHGVLQSQDFSPPQPFTELVFSIPVGDSLIKSIKGWRSANKKTDVILIWLELIVEGGGTPKTLILDSVKSNGLPIIDTVFSISQEGNQIKCKSSKSQNWENNYLVAYKPLNMNPEQNYDIEIHKIYKIWRIDMALLTLEPKNVTDYRCRQIWGND